ncbi:hypothetical protein [Streptomyces sp. NBC_01483]|uniref:hypothetical protein n=1 Tax=Streptomyces sp. NBC_01483 TaxID=2903883 RepID=UPI002E3533F1|nr:hypothetical protein [Streptomyces sp. NBC_01483]
MSDRSALQLYIYAMPDEDRAAVQLGIDDNGLEPDDDSGDGIVLGVRYLTEEVPVGSAYDLAVHLLKEAPGTAFELWQDPVFEHAGRYVAHLPGIGAYEGVCDSYGSPLVKLTEVLDALTMAPDSTSALPADHVARHASFFTALRRAQTARRP